MTAPTVTGPAHDGPADDGPAHDGPAHDGPAHDGLAHDGLGPLLRWLPRQPDPVDLELVCAEHDRPGRGRAGRTVVQLDGCAATLAPSVHLELLAAGVSSLTVRLDECLAPEVALGVVDQANALLTAAGATVHVVAEVTGGVRRRVVHRTDDLPVPRRAVLGLRPGTRDAVVPRPVADPARAATALRVLAPAVATSPPAALSLLAAPGARLEVTGCTGCGTCVRSCPTAALSLRAGLPHPDGSVTQVLALAPVDCTGCDECLTACPEDAVRRVGELTWADVVRDGLVPLAEVRTVECRRCGAPVPAGGGGLCPVCAFRRSSPFGSLVFPEVPGPQNAAPAPTTAPRAPGAA
ncbi:4Fe-4S dicluster domain-containing protein [Actinotalea sp. K2]|uniref:4Fe-4S dicluster domain-containing protein n=1 Tax=Actinotalea sp. K2 TaxID=2939438 RepID=UPI0020173FB7|nr:4Fe-4S dicluster domain-containing protein [Actinotalea sp. K2]MCL3860740.1 4Fe-4S dicluster domain-containing protein [Actinotalea sp. K2]